MAACVKHPFDDAVGLCRSCAEAFCGECLVYVHGPDRPPLCVPCALVAAGVRRLSPAERRAHRSRQRARAAEAFAAARPASSVAAGEFGPMSERGRALLAARNGHGASDGSFDGADDGAPITANGADNGGGPSQVAGPRRRRFFGLF